MATLADIERDDPNFIADLVASQGPVWLVARYLHEKGNQVNLKPVRVRDQIKDMHKFSDDGDLEIVLPIEVKHRKELVFTSAKDYPFSTVIVDTVHAHDQKPLAPYAYIIVNAAMTAICIVPRSSKKYWTKREREDTQKKRKRVFYECPLKFVQFERLSQEAEPQA